MINPLIIGFFLGIIAIIGVIIAILACVMRNKNKNDRAKAQQFANSGVSTPAQPTGSAVMAQNGKGEPI